MLTRIGLSPEALVDISANSGNSFAARALWESLVRTFRAHGTLLVTSAGELDRFIALTKDPQLTVDERKRLAALIVQLRKENRLEAASPALEGPLDQVANTAALQALQGGEPLVVVLPRETFQKLSPDNLEGVARLANTLETAVGETLPLTETIQQFTKREDAQHYPINTPREQVWRELFSPLARRFNRVTILDRYLLTELTNRESRGGTWRDEEHLGWLLQKLDRESPEGTRVVIYTQLDDPRDNTYGPVSAEGALDMIDRNWKRGSEGRINAIELYGVRWRPKQHPHNRHIRFGDALGYKLDEGLDRLAARQISYDSGFNYTYVWKGEQMRKLRADEELIRSSREVDHAEWTF